MADSLSGRIKHAWNAFRNIEQPQIYGLGPSYGYRQDRTPIFSNSDRQLVTAITTQIAIDAASADLRHVRLDDQGRFGSDIDSKLDYCLAIEANIDQAGSAFRQDLFYTIVDKGVAAIVPVETSTSPVNSNMFDVLQLRVGEILEWFPQHVRVRVYNESATSGQREELILKKSMVGIVENPRYNVMNAPNSMMQRLLRKLTLLDVVDDKNAAGKLDIIIQLPFALKTEAKKAEADRRRKEIEMQLVGSEYGIAYTDATERITQLNRPVENTIMGQIPYLTNMVYGQLGITEAILNGTANEREMLNYNNRTIEPLLRAAAEEIARKFLSKTARSQGQSIMYFKDPFKYVPVEQIADIADKFTRAKALTSNEIRAIIGRKPSNDPDADKLQNPNLNQPVTETSTEEDPGPEEDVEVEVRN